MISLISQKYLLISFILLAIGVGLFFQSCAGAKKWKKHIDGPIVFGSYGGFVGSFDEYTILQDGSVYYRKSIKGESNIIHKLDEELKKEIFQKIKSDKIYLETMDEPGNMTYFIKFNYKSKEHHIKWGGQHDPSPQLLDYFNLLRKNMDGKNPTM